MNPSAECFQLDTEQKKQEKIKQLPFNIQEVPTKKKKKSIASQKMKEKKNALRLLNGKDQYGNLKSQVVSEDEDKVYQPAKNIKPDDAFDHINYISLQQFEGAIEDQRTLQIYKKAITQNSHLFINKIVLHLTTGCNCFYSIYAAQAGAAKVYCVVNGHNLSQSQNVWMMQQIIKQNQLQDIIEVLFFKDFNAEVDIIIGQPMGYCMHYDGMLDRMIQARDLYLDKKNGIILPNKLNFKCALINDQHFYDKKIQFWNKVYDIPMKSMQKWISHQPIVKIVDPSLIVSQIKRFVEFDLNKINYQQIQQIKRQFELNIYSSTQCNGLSIWFQIQFNCEGQKVQLKASPWQDATKFTHVTLYTSKKLQFKENQVVKIKTSGKKYPHHGVSVMKVNIANQHEGVYTFS